MIIRDNIVWKPVVGAEDRYEVSNYGNIHRKQFVTRKNGGGHFVVPEKWFPHEDHEVVYNGYQRFRISTANECYVHRIVAKAFLGEPKKPRMEVNHIDGDKTNNHVSNLEWVTRKQNCEHASKMGLINRDSPKRKVAASQNIKKAIQKQKRPIIQLDKDGHFIAEYPSISAAKAVLGGYDGCYSNAAARKGYHKTYLGFQWVYKDQYLRA